MKHAKILVKQKITVVPFPDGEKINQGKNYKDYRREHNQKLKKWVNPCKHKKVMLTQRCDCCNEVRVKYVRGMVK